MRFALALLVLFIAWWGGGVASAAVPAAAIPYQRTLVRESHALWGLDAPLTVFAGQIEQESHWRPKVCSAFACGLTQFTPDTAKRISLRYTDLRIGDVFNPEWAIRALIHYDHDLYAKVVGATPCDTWAFALSAYNGGLKWVPRDKDLAQAHGKDRNRWWGNVELYTSRAPKYAKENRGYPRLILLQNQFHYADWGEPVSCPVPSRSSSSAR